MPSGGQFAASSHSESSVDLMPSATTGLGDDGWHVDDPDVVDTDDLFANVGDITWKGAGFSRDEAGSWTAAGAVSPDSALTLLHSGFTPESASATWSTDEWPGEAPETVSIARALERGDLAGVDLRMLLPE